MGNSIRGAAAHAVARRLIGSVENRGSKLAQGAVGERIADGQQQADSEYDRSAAGPPRRAPSGAQPDHHRTPHRQRERDRHPQHKIDQDLQLLATHYLPRFISTTTACRWHQPDGSKRNCLILNACPEMVQMAQVRLSTAPSDGRPGRGAIAEFRVLRRVAGLWPSYPKS